jgi:hypothetical protein
MKYFSGRDGEKYNMQNYTRRFIIATVMLFFSFCAYASDVITIKIASNCNYSVQFDYLIGEVRCGQQGYNYYFDTMYVDGQGRYVVTLTVDDASEINEIYVPWTNTQDSSGHSAWLLNIDNSSAHTTFEVTIEDSIYTGDGVILNTSY